MGKAHVFSSCLLRCCAVAAPSRSQKRRAPTAHCPLEQHRPLPTPGAGWSWLTPVVLVRWSRRFPIGFDARGLPLQSCHSMSLYSRRPAPCQGLHGPATADGLPSGKTEASIPNAHTTVWQVPSSAVGQRLQTDLASQRPPPGPGSTAAVSIDYLLEETEQL